MDFDFAKLLQKREDKDQERTSTLVGLPFYWAPEMMSPNGYDFMVDLWALGVCLYELVTGIFPFGNQEDDTYELMEKVRKAKLEFPEHFMNNDKYIRFRSFVEILLHKNPLNRMGSKMIGMKLNYSIGDYETLKQHFWFQDFDFVSFNKGLFIL